MLLDKIELFIVASVRLRDAGAPLEPLLIQAIDAAPTVAHCRLYTRIMFAIYREPHAPREELIAKFRKIANER